MYSNTIYVFRKGKRWASPMAKRFSLSAPLRWPRVCFPGWEPGCRHGTTHQAMLRLRPTWFNWKDLQLEYTTRYWGPLGRRGRKRGRLATDVSSGPILKKKKKTLSMFENTCIHEQLFSDIKCIVVNIAPYYMTQG